MAEYRINPYKKAFEAANLNKNKGKGKNVAPINKNAVLRGGGSSWWQAVFGNSNEKPDKSSTDYGTTRLESKYGEIKEKEKALEEENQIIEKNKLDKAKLEENKEKYRIADQKLKDVELDLENAKRKNNNNKGKNKAGDVGKIRYAPEWIGRKN